MAPPQFSKPENTLKRAHELIAVEQPQAALTVLHEYVTSKRSRSTPVSSLEPLMLLFVELCVEQKRGKYAKDGLYQYKNVAQNSNIGTIELVLTRFIQLAEKKVTEAQQNAEQAQETTSVEDLEATETPELLLAAVTSEESKDRTERAIITPWLKFLWETYRTVLEILKNNSRLEIMYQTTAHQAFDFCLRYTRKTEFRRLCELLRNHVQNAHKYSSQMHSINLNEPDTLQRHLETRFRQLNVADELELWQEAFRSVEDIHMLMTLSKRPAKNVMMANYYEKLTKIFLVGDNFLFHAAAYNRYYNLLRQSQVIVASGQGVKRDNPQVSEEALTKYASFVVLSALSIPVISTSRSRGVLIDSDEARKSKNTRLTNLLSMPAAPTRAGLIKDILTKGLLRRARSEIKDLYTILEVDFHPLSICKKISPILAKIGQDTEMVQYVGPLQQVILTRLLQQLSQVYESVDLKYVVNLAQFPGPFEIAPNMIEKFIMNGCKKGELAIRLDHVSGILSFDSDVFSCAKALQSSPGSADNEGSVQQLQNTPSEIARSQLSRLAKTLSIVCTYVDPTYIQERLAIREAAFERAEKGAEAEHADNLARRAIIEKRKEAAADTLARKQRDEEAAKKKRAQEAAAAESQRLRNETAAREQKRIRDEQARIKRQEVEKQLNELKGGMKIDLEDINIDELDSNAIRNLKLTQLEKDKKKKDAVIATTAKRIDHLERAFRREELHHINEDYAQQKENDRKVYEKNKEIALEESQIRFKESIALKHRLSRLVNQYDTFKTSISGRRHKEFERLRQKAEKDFEKEKEARVKQVMAERAAAEQRRLEQERREREEQERIEKEAADKEAAEAEKRRKLEERKAAADADRAERDAAARKQLEREEEAARRAAERKAGGSAGGRFMDERQPSSSSARPVVAGLKPGGWRERAAAKEAAGANSESAAAVEQLKERAEVAQEGGVPQPAPATRSGGYVPPALRAARGGDAAGSSMGERSFSRGDREPPRFERAPERAPEKTAERPAEPREALPKRTGGYVPPHLRNKQ